MIDTQLSGPCVGGPHDGEQKTYGSNRMPVLAGGADTEGQLLGYYVHGNGKWQWRPEDPPDDDDRVR